MGRRRARPLPWGPLLRLAGLVGCAAAGLGRAGAAEPLPRWPEQFSGALEVTLHRVDPGGAFPGSRTQRVWYDALQGRFRLDSDLPGGGRESVVKRYDRRRAARTVEWDAADGARACTASGLSGGGMPMAEWPAGARRAGREAVRGADCEKWVVDNSDTRVHIFLSATGQPVRLEVFSVASDLPSCTPVPDITYDFTEFRPGPPAEAAFPLPDPEACEPQPNDMGFPYEHFFHYYLRA